MLYQLLRIMYLLYSVLQYYSIISYIICSAPTHVNLTPDIQRMRALSSDEVISPALQRAWHQLDNSRSILSAWDFLPSLPNMFALLTIEGHVSLYSFFFSGCIFLLYQAAGNWLFFLLPFFFFFLPETHTHKCRQKRWEMSILIGNMLW